MRTDNRPAQMDRRPISRILRDVNSLNTYTGTHRNAKTTTKALTTSRHRETMSNIEQIYYVAKEPRADIYGLERYACKRDMYIESTEFLSKAIRSSSVEGLMRQLSGHYRGYVPIKVVETIQRTITKAKWANPKKVWSEDD